MKYELNSRRVVSLWFPQFIICSLFVSTLFVIKETFGIIFLAVVLLLFVGPFVHLFFNHFRFARGTRVLVKGETIEVIQGEEVSSFSTDEIDTIVQHSSETIHSTRGPFWGDIMWWRITTRDKTVDISNLIISKADFRKTFGTDIIFKYEYFPFIQKTITEN